MKTAAKRMFICKIGFDAAENGFDTAENGFDTAENGFNTAENEPSKF